MATNTAHQKRTILIKYGGDCIAKRSGCSGTVRGISASPFCDKQEVIVWPEDLKTEHDSQVILKQKYVKFNEEVAAQEGHFNDVMKLADLLIEGNHPEDIVIRRRREVNRTAVGLESTNLLGFLKNQNFT